MIEYRVCWNASSNASFRGASDWESWQDEDATHGEVIDALEVGAFKVPAGLEMALDQSGFEWFVETRIAVEDPA